MKKIIYCLCVCALVVLVVHEIISVPEQSINQTSSGRYVTTALFESEIEQENEKTKEKVAYLTFDDGPSENSEKILKTLKEKDAVATFFLIGQEITSEREEIVKQELQQGNAVGVHTYCHEQNVIYSNSTAFFDDFQKASAAIEKVTGVTPKLHRFPWGSNNSYVSYYVDSLREQLNSQGVKSFDWNVSGEDSVGRNVSESVIFANVKKDLTKYQNPIILLHDSAAMDNTAAVLPQIIDYIREQGYSFDTLENREEYLFPASWR